MTVWNFVVSVLSGAAVSILLGLVFIGRYQQKIDSLEKALPTMQKSLQEALSGIAYIKGELSRINGRH